MTTAKVYLCYHKATRPTGRVMAKELGISHFGIRQPMYDNLDVLIRWGSCAPMPEARVVVNDSRAIATASNKVTAFEAMQQAGILTVPFYATFEQAASEWPIVFGRSFRGYGGKDIVVYNLRAGEKPARSHDFYTGFIQAPREARLHVVGDKVVRTQMKYNDFPEQNDKGFIKNYKHGYRFRAPREELHASRRHAAIKAVKACGLDFGAVDLLVFGDRQHYVLEVNTAPACSPLTARCYAGELAILIQARTNGAVRLAPSVMEAELSYEEMED